MLFSSYIFLLCFLPTTLFSYFCCARLHRALAVWSLIVLSSVFYAWNNPYALLLIYGSIGMNFWIANLMIARNRTKIIFVCALLLNVLLLILFKYLDFFTRNINFLLHLKLPLFTLPLPLAISFFTFQQIAFLTEVFKNKTAIPFFREYASFVLFFPQLIAGPIVKHGDYLPQLRKYSTYTFSWRNAAIGATLFIVGLFKKTMLADHAAIVADWVFEHAGQDLPLHCIEAWIGIFAYSFQIYFDFSGYSDMAIGLARLFNIQLPCNFLSPYKATSLIEFWKRWHISLSQFLQEYVYIPLGGNRKGSLATVRNLLFTMLIGGLWHGASWTFVLWGGVHGLFLAVNHGVKRFSCTLPSSIRRAFVFVIVSLAWVLFRADNLQIAQSILSSSLAYTKRELHMDGFMLFDALTCLPCFFIIVFLLPNAYEWMGQLFPLAKKKKLLPRWLWRPNLAYALYVVILLLLAFSNIHKENEFIYFRF